MAAAGGAGARSGVRTLEDEMAYITSTSAVRHEIAPGFAPNMRVGGTFYVNKELMELQMEELTQYSKSGGVGGFLPAVKQIANVAALPGIVHRSIGLPDLHSGYGFAIGNVAAFDMADPTAIVSPGGVGFDINCGVRLVRTNLMESDVAPVKEALTQSLYDHIPVGVGSKGIIPTGGADLEAALEMGMDWSLREGYAWAEDKEHCFAPHTRVLLADGTVRALGDCAVGDALVDDHGRARTLVRHARGHGQLYTVAYNASASFTCNGGHQLVVYVATAVAATNSGGCVTRTRLAWDAALRMAVPSVAVTERHADGDAAARAAAAASPAHVMWQPTVTQYLAFAAAYPDRVHWCHMMAAAPRTLPAAAAAARHLPIVQAAREVGAAVHQVAYLVGAWLGAAHVRHACAVLPQSPAAAAVAAAARALGLGVTSTAAAWQVDVAGVAPCSAFGRLLQALGLAHTATAAADDDDCDATLAALTTAPDGVRAHLLAGIVDCAGVRRCGGWQVPASAAAASADRVDAAHVALRVAQALGFSATAVDRAVRITAAAGDDGDVVSPCLLHARHRVPPTCGAAHRAARGRQLYTFSVAPAGEGAFISAEVDGDDHRFLLADYLVVHNCEEYGRMLTADPSKVTKRAKKRGLPQLGTLGAGNHYAEIQVVDEIFDKAAASRMGIEEVGQVCVMIHSGSRGLGHQVATDSLVEMERAMVRDGIATNDRQLACARIASPEGQTYLAAMAAAANYAWVNRASMTFLTRQAFSKVFGATPDDLDMHVIYDVSHNIAKVEEHLIDGRPRKLLVHRKGATRAFPPHHPLIPVDYQFIGQPVLIGGTMGTCSYVLTGTERGMADTLGSTCHGAGRAASRAKSRRTLTYDAVLDALEAKGISFRLASPKLVMEEAPESYKDVTAVVDTCHEAGISRKAIKLRPIGVVKG